MPTSNYDSQYILSRPDIQGFYGIWGSKLTIESIEKDILIRLLFQQS